MPTKSHAELQEVKKPTSAERILERAIEVIEEGGEVAIRTNIIAAECGVTPPILYRAFESREGLVIAALAERYKRSSDRVTKALADAIEGSNSKEELYATIRASLEAMFQPDRIPLRRLRAQILGSAAKRPALQNAIQQIDKEFACRIMVAYKRATDEQWVNPKAPLDHVALWAISLVNARVMIEQGADLDLELGESWNRLTLDLILHAIFGEP